MFEHHSGSTMMRTGQLRWFTKETGERVLQESWAPMMGGQIEWRNIPEVHERHGEMATALASQGVKEE